MAAPTTTAPLVVTKRRNPAMTKLRQRLTGVAFLLVPALLIWLSIAIYNKDFQTVTMVTLKAGDVGHQMHQGADVKVRGVVVGEVRSVSGEGEEAILKLAISPSKDHLIPSDVTAQMLPTTVFGERYVSLNPPVSPTGAGTIKDGATISEDRSSDSIELQEVLKNTMSLLTAVKPAELSATLNAMSQALQGRGTQLGQNFVQLNSYLGKLNPHLPALTRNIRELAKLADNYSQAAPDLLQALNDFTTTSRTIVDQRANLSELYTSMTNSSQDLTSFLRANSANLITLARTSRLPLQALGRYSPEFPCTFKMISQSIPLFDMAFGKGSDQPGVHVKINSVQSQGRYLPGKDTPHYSDNSGPHCYGTPYKPGTGTVPKMAATPDGLPNSVAEGEMVNELAALNAGRTPSTMPDWSSVLVGPIFRGSRTEIQ